MAVYPTGASGQRALAWMALKWMLRVPFGFREPTYGQRLIVRILQKGQSIGYAKAEKCYNA